MDTRSISLKQIMDDITSNPLLKDMQEDQIVKYAITFIGKLGTPLMYDSRQADVDIDDYMALLPCDFIEAIQVMLFHDNHLLPMHVSTSTFAPRERYSGMDRFTYKIKGNVIHTSFEKGKIHLSYKSIKTDEEGYPMMMGDPVVVNAFESFIIREQYFNLFSLGRISQNVYNEAKQRYAYDAAQAFERLSMPSREQMENIGNIINAIIPSSRPNLSAYSTLSNQEKYITH